MYRELLAGCGSGQPKKLYAPIGHEEWSNLIRLDYNADHSPDIVHDLNNRPLPFEDSYFDELHFYEVLEHLGHQGDWKGFFDEFSEYYRILKPGGVLIGTVPSWNSPWAWGDPSHTRVISAQTFSFLSQSMYASSVGVTCMSDFRFYWKGNFNTMLAKEENGHLYFILQKA